MVHGVPGGARRSRKLVVAEVKVSDLGEVGQSLGRHEGQLRTKRKKHRSNSIAFFTVFNRVPIGR